MEIKKEVEKARNLCLSKAKRKEFGDCGKYVDFKSIENGEISDNKIISTINTDKVEEDLALAGYNLIITSEVKMETLEIYNAYHNLWKIEETFKIMKSELDARPVYLQEENKIKGHFLICYLSVLMERILEVHVLKNEYNYREIFELIREFEVVINEDKYINISKRTILLEEIEKKTNLSIMNFYLEDKDIKKVLNYKL